jgi:branched-chain amino acid transport system permease protein
MYWTWGLAAFTVIFMAAFMSSSYGRALKAIREDEVAAQSMGIDIFKHKILSFTISAFFAGIGGGLLASLIATIDPNMFRFTLTFQVLLMIVLGGMKSITGSFVGAAMVTILMEALRSVEKTIDLGFIVIPGISGMRMLVFSITLILVVVFLREGIVGERELSWRIFGIKEGDRHRSS